MPDFTITVSPLEATAHGEHIIAVARNVCASTPGYAVPVKFECALACTAIGWPMQYGTIMLEFFRVDQDCPEEGLLYSRYLTNMFSFPLGCIPGDPSPEGTWQGQVVIPVAVIAGPPPKGISFRISATMTVEDDASVNVIVKVERLVPASEIVPPPANGLGTYIELGSFSKNLTRTLSVGNSLRNQPWNMEHEGLIPFAPLQPFDAQSVRVKINLNPFKVGCDGTANNGAVADCSLDTGSRTYACFSAIIKPTLPGTFRPRWVQLGVNASWNETDSGCFYGNNAGPDAIPPIAQKISPNIVSNPLPYEILNVGCPGENTKTGDVQSIQYSGERSISIIGYSEPYHDILIKSVNKGSPCIAMRVHGAGNPWTLGNYSIDTRVLTETGHWVATATFPGLAGSPIAIVYGLEFPSGAVAACVDSLKSSQPMQSLPQIAEDHPVRAIVAKMKAVKTSPCIHLGQQLETTPSCGCSGGNLYECAKHGKCRVQGNTIEMNCWRCPDYIDRTENNGMIDGNNGG